MFRNVRFLRFLLPNIEHGLPLNIKISGVDLEEVKTYKYLGFWLVTTLSFHSHIDHLISKANKRIGLIKHSRKFLGEKCSLILYKSLVLPVIDYGDLLYWKSSAYKLSALQILQNKFCRILLRTGIETSTADLHNSLRLMKLDCRQTYHYAIFVFKTVKGLHPANIIDKLQLPYEDRALTTRAGVRGDFMIPPLLLRVTEASFSYSGPELWNSLPQNLREAQTVNEFKKLYFETFSFV